MRHRAAASLRVTHLLPQEEEIVVGNDVSHRVGIGKLALPAQPSLTVKGKQIMLYLKHRFTVIRPGTPDSAGQQKASTGIQREHTVLEVRRQVMQLYDTLALGYTVVRTLRPTVVITAVLRLQCAGIDRGLTATGMPGNQGRD